MQRIKRHFQRFEFKYLITPEQEREIKKRVYPYMESDVFASQTVDKSYQVNSLYFDSPRLFYYHQKIDGVQRRKKIRIRTYRNNGVFVPYGFLEIKRKHDAVILKDRFVLENRAWRLFVQPGSAGTMLAAGADQYQRKVMEEYLWEQTLRMLAPAVLVIYDREPCLGKMNKNVRITFDKRIRAKLTDDPFYGGADTTDVSGRMTVMELKFTGTLPFYIANVIQEFNLERIAYSKYCHAVDACGLLVPEPLRIAAALEYAADMSGETEGAAHVLT